MSAVRLIAIALAAIWLTSCMSKSAGNGNIGDVVKNMGAVDDLKKNFPPIGRASEFRYRCIDSVLKKMGRAPLCELIKSLSVDGKGLEWKDGTGNVILQSNASWSTMKFVPLDRDILDQELYGALEVMHKPTCRFFAFESAKRSYIALIGYSPSANGIAFDCDIVFVYDVRADSIFSFATLSGSPAAFCYYDHDADVDFVEFAYSDCFMLRRNYDSVSVAAKIYSFGVNGVKCSGEWKGVACW